MIWQIQINGTKNFAMPTKIVSAKNADTKATKTPALAQRAVVINGDAHLVELG